MIGQRLGARFVGKQHHCLVLARTYQILARFSSWEIPRIPWRRISEEEIEKAKALVVVQKQRDELTKYVQTAVRSHLQSQFPKAFSLTSSRSIWKNFRTKELNEKAHTLLALNGFQRVPLPKRMDMLMLAEGVVAFPNFYSRIVRAERETKFLLFAQPIVKDNSKETQKDKMYPSIIQEDIHVYRLLENQAERIINAIYNVAQAFVKNVIHLPFELIIERIQVTTHRLRETLISSSDPVISAAASHPNIRLPSMVHQHSTEPSENLLVIGEGREELTLLAHMNPNVRLVALPFVLGHKSASTLVSVSLVFFGAIPLAYRSLNFAFLYPGLSEALAISVVGTITYGIWSQRYNARTSQSLAVADALLHRVQARNDAVVLVLQEGAVREVSRAILSKYFDQLVQQEAKKRGKHYNKELLAQLNATNAVPVSVACTELVDASELAIKLRLIDPPLGAGEPDKLITVGDGRKDQEYTAVSLEEATRRVQVAITGTTLSN